MEQKIDIEQASDSLLYKEKHDQQVQIKQILHQQSIERFSKLEISLMGCKHYKRCCKLQAPCCQQWVSCRLCHDEFVEQNTINRYHDINNQNQQEEEEKFNHLQICDVQKMDRFKVQYIYCILCNHIQKPSQKCFNCNAILGNYFCAHCNLYENDQNKQIFHCDDCGICVVGKRDQLFHCQVCGICIAKKKKESHICLKDALDRECPICLENMKHSAKKCVHFRTCGHWIHRDCFQQYISDRKNMCPICSQAIRKQDKQTILEMDFIVKQALEHLTKNSEIDIQYVNIICNECSQVSKQVPETYTNLYKCQQQECGTYNTKLIQ